jgi:hypothetical protein
MYGPCNVPGLEHAPYRKLTWQQNFVWSWVKLPARLRGAHAAVILKHAEIFTQLHVASTEVAAYQNEFFANGDLRISFFVY